MRPATRVMAYILLAVGVEIVVPNFPGPGPRPSIRTCFSGMKTMSGALEMLAVDLGERAGAYPESVETMRKQGYLEQVPSCGSYGPGSVHLWEHSDRSRSGLLCLVHGAPYLLAADGTPVPEREYPETVVEHLARAGFDEILLDRARHVAAHLKAAPLPQPRAMDRNHIMLALFLGAALLLELLVRADAKPPEPQSRESLASSGGGASGTSPRSTPPVDAPGRPDLDGTPRAGPG